MQLFKGKPTDSKIREERETRVYDLLCSLGIEFTRVDHDAAETMEACLDIDKALGVNMCKNLFLCNRQKTDYYLLLMPGDKPFRTKELTHQINSARLSFSDADDMLTYLDITPGSVSVMGLMNDRGCRVRLLIDSDLLSEQYIGCHPCKNTSSMKILTDDIINKFLPAVKHSYTAVTLTGNDNID